MMSSPHRPGGDCDEFHSRHHSGKRIGNNNNSAFVRIRKRSTPTGWSSSNSPLLFVGVILATVQLLTTTIITECSASNDGRRPPPPPPPRVSSTNRRRGDDDYWQRKEEPYAGLDRPYAEPADDNVPDTLAGGWPSTDNARYTQDGPYSGGDGGGNAGGWYSNDNEETSSQPHPQQDPYNYYDETPQQMSSDPMARDAATYGAAAAKEEIHSNPSSSSIKVPQTPIHYEFPVSKETTRDGPETGRRHRREDRDVDADEYGGIVEKDPPASASARRDLVTRYWATKTGKAQIMITSTLIGVALGNFLGQSLIGSVQAWMTGTALVFWMSTWFRTPVGELVRAMGLSLLLVLQRSRRIRRTYPTWRYIPAAVGVGSKRGLRPFPPARNPWRYTPRSPRDPNFNMMFVLASMAFVGSMVGGNLPVIPTWMGALAGAASFAFACTWQSPRGDLARSCGMRVVSAVGELWEIQADLAIIPKATVVSSQIIDKAMILDRKHRVKDRFLSLANKGYEQASKLATQIHDQQRGGNGNNERDNNSRSDDRDRPRGDEGGRRDDLQRRGGRADFDDRDAKRRHADDDDFRIDPRDRMPPRERQDDREFGGLGDDSNRPRPLEEKSDRTPKRKGFWKR